MSLSLSLYIYIYIYVCTDIHMNVFLCPRLAPRRPPRSALVPGTSMSVMSGHISLSIYIYTERERETYIYIYMYIYTYV